MKKESAPCAGKKYPPAIPLASLAYETRLFELSETVTVFDEQLMRKVCNHFPLVPVDGQLCLWGDAVR